LAVRTVDRGVSAGDRVAEGNGKVAVVSRDLASYRG
jgi:hypothetical protein